MRSGAGGLALAAGFRLPALRRHRAQPVPAQWHILLAMLALPSPDQLALGHDHGQQQAAAAYLVVGHVPAGPEQDQPVGIGADAALRRELPGGVAD